MCGIYLIRNKINGKTYVGSSVNINKRWNEHKHHLRKNKHHSSYLQRSWNKYGEENFIFYELITCDKEKLLEVEQYYMNIFQSEYNVAKTVGRLNNTHLSPEHKDKISKGNKGKTLGLKRDEKFKDMCREKSKKQSEKDNVKKLHEINKIKVEVDGIIFNSITECAKYLGVGKGRLSAYKSGTLKTVKGKNLIFYETDKKLNNKQNRKKVIGKKREKITWKAVYNDIEYFATTLQQLSEKLNLTYNYVYGIVRFNRIAPLQITKL